MKIKLIDKLKSVLLILTMLFLFSIVLTSCGTYKVSSKDDNENLNCFEDESNIKNEVTEVKCEPVIRKASISFTGDIMVHDYQYNEAYDNKTRIYDFFHNFKDVKKYFDKTDLTVGNLETVFAGEDIGYSDYPMFNTPDSFGNALQNAGFDIVTTANNHCMDKGKKGLERTIDVLDSLGIKHMGTYKTKEDRDNILIKDVNGIKIAFLSYTYGTNGINVPEEYLVNIISEDLIKSDIKRANDRGADIIVVMPHMGNEYETYSKDIFKNWVNLMLNAGADVVIASHPHVLQPMEYKTIVNEDGTIRTGFVIYSMGNFISSQTTPPRNASIILNMSFQKTDNQRAVIQDVSFIPIWTQFRGTDGKNNFVVRSVYEMLTLSEDKKKHILRKKDIERLNDIHFETTYMLLKKDIPIEDIKDEYYFENN